MIIDYLKKLTFLSKEEIEELEAKNIAHPEEREAHRALAKEIICDLHGIDEYDRAVKLSNLLFNEEFKELTKEDIKDIFNDSDIVKVTETDLTNLLIEIGASKSKREAREFITGGAIKVSGKKITDVNYKVEEADFIDSTYIIIKKGKKNYYVGKRS